MCVCVWWIVGREERKSRSRQGRERDPVGQDRTEQDTAGQGRANTPWETDYYLLVTPALALCRKGPDCCTRKTQRSQGRSVCGVEWKADEMK